MKKPFGFSLLSVSLLLGATCFLAQAQAASIVASYAFTDSSLASVDADSGTTASNFSGIPVPNVTVQPGTAAYAAFDSPTVWTASTGYASFTLTPGMQPLDFSSLTFDYGYHNITSGGDYALRMFTSATGFSNVSDAIWFSGLTNPAGNASITPAHMSVDLASISALQAVTTPIEFRFYFTDSHGAISRYHLIDNVELMAAAVPEPSAYAALVGALSLGLVVARRKRRVVVAV